MFRILTLKKILKLFIITILFVLIGASIIGIGFSEQSNDPIVIFGSTRENYIIWDFDDTKNYLTNNTVITNGIVQLDTISSFLNQSTPMDYNNGKTQNITITEAGGLELSFDHEELIIDVNTDRSETTSIHSEQAGYQTFRFNRSIIISKIKFLARLDDDVSSNLNVSIETENNETLDFRSLSPSTFKSEINEISVNFSCRINANTIYRLKFESVEDDGSYKIVGDPNSVYSDGYFQELELDDDDDMPEEPDDEDIDFKIYALTYSASGIFESEVCEFASPVIWTDLYWLGKHMTYHGAIKVQLRVGNSSNTQDTSWTKWIDVEENSIPDNMISIPPATCIQYKIILSTIDPYQTPTFEWINISYERYFLVGSIETLDFETHDPSLWLNFSSGSVYQDQNIKFYFSLDSGSQWSLISSDKKSINLNVLSKKIRFLVKFNSENSAISPTLDNISLSFTKFNPEIETEIEIGPEAEPGKAENDQESKDELPMVQPDTEPQITPPKLRSEPQILPPGTVLILGVFAGLVSIIGWGMGTETGKYTFLRRFLFCIIPLYNKIDRDKVLDNYLRNQIYKYIQTNPGTNYSEIMKDTGVKNGVLVHHLKTLDREGLIKSIRDGMFRRFYPIGVKIPKKEIDTLSWFQMRIFNFIRMNPGTTPKEIAGEVGKSKQVINYHLNLMKNAALVRAEDQGKYTQLYVMYSESESKIKT